MSGRIPPPGNQGHQSSCVAWALAYSLKSYQERVESGSSWKFTAGGKVVASRVFSPSYVYNQINNGMDGGSSFIDGLNVLSQQGCATLLDMEYDPSDFASKPSAEARRSARKYRIDYWRRVNVRDVKEVKAQLAAGFPVAFGADVDESFARADADFVWRKRSGKSLGGHAMLLVGYDDREGAFKLVNSWGAEWGDAGCGWIDYDFFTSIAREGYVAKDAKSSRDDETADDGDESDGDEPDVVDDTIRSSLRMIAIDHNVPLVERQANALRVRGTLNTESAVGRTIQVVVRFYSSATTRAGTVQLGTAARSRRFPSFNGQPDPAFVDVHGLAACGTPIMRLERDLTNEQWFATIPYAVIEVPADAPVVIVPTQFGPRPAAQLVAVAELFVDGFGVATSEPIGFTIVQ